MKKDLKALMPQTVAPVQRETSATVSRDGNAITPHKYSLQGFGVMIPFAGDDAE
ncbi:MAG: anacyclamide/piricyclamide family prenylated cyclic peptide [Limnothrix sp. CACIAM 69d]|nr:MAG: anacyclamide/piricyclamide family prenylated cyclic peptide [Limnothrix sp. CACIAM 69d]